MIKLEESQMEKCYTLRETEFKVRAWKNKILNFWCFNPGLGFRKLLKLEPRAVILTSGTLSPLKSF